MVHLEKPLLPPFTDLNLNDKRCSLPHDEDPITIEFAPSNEEGIDVSVLLVGGSTSLSRLRDAIPQLARWLGNSPVTFVANIQEAEDWGELENIHNLINGANIDATIVPNQENDEASDRHAQRHFDIIKLLYEQRQPHHKWFAVVDDDTFFPSLPALMKALEPYHPSYPWYIGQLSEDWHGVRHFGHMAYGGAGIFISLPLLKILYEHFDSCKTAGFEGDGMFRDCIYTRTSPPVQLNRLPGLHQMDLLGDVSGWYEAGIRPLLSLHHYNGWHLYPIQSGHLASDVCGLDCFLQRYRYSDDVVLTNGYSVVQYPKGVDRIDFDRVEGTFDHEKGQFDFSLGALRPKVDEEDKISWRMEYALREEDGRVRQFYVRRKHHGKNDEERLKSKVESIFELEWKLDLA